MNKYFLFAPAIISLCACTKAGPGGSASIKGTVKYNSKPIPGSTVYIKYGSKTSPGANVTYYNASVNTDANANYEIDNLKRGDYYLFAIGYDTLAGKTASGGIGTSITTKTETDQVDIPVTE
jgi:hypothetical protein